MRHVEKLVALVAGAGLIGFAVGASAQEAAPPPQPPPVVVQPPAGPGTVVVEPQPGQPVVVEPAPAQPVETPPAQPVETTPPPVVPAPTPVSQPYHEHHHHGYWSSFSPMETALTVGGGVADFSFGPMRAATEVGAEWDARLTVGTRSFFAFEAGYAGTYNKMQSPVEGAGSVAPYMVNNSVDGDFRLNLLPFRIQPYVFGGLGYNHASVNNLAENPGMAQRFAATDDQLLVPAGGGMAFYLGRHTTIDTRFTYRAIFEDHLDLANPNGRLDQWVATGRFGYAF